MTCSLRTILLAAAIVATTTAAAASTQKTWTGVMKSGDGKRTRVVATIDGDKASLRFAEPANCVIAAGILDAEDDTTIYRFHVPRNGGPFCARLYPGELFVTAPAGTSIRVMFRRQQVPWSGVLDRAVDP